jgi:hypothetical protein
MSISCKVLGEESVEGNNGVDLGVWSKQVAAVAVSMGDDDPTGLCSAS